MGSNCRGASLKNKTTFGDSNLWKHPSPTKKKTTPTDIAGAHVPAGSGSYSGPTSGSGSVVTAALLRRRTAARGAPAPSAPQPAAPGDGWR